MDEMWKAIDGYEGLYEVSNFGRVRSIRPRIGKGGWQLSDDGTLRLNDANGDYLRITFACGPKKFKTHLVHRLVVKAFIGDIPNGMDVNHIDGNTNNNCADNLEIVTKKRNTQHAIEIGLFDINGEKNPMAKLSNEQAKEIRRLVASGLTGREVARQFCVSPATVSGIVSGRSWGNVQ